MAVQGSPFGLAGVGGRAAEAGEPPRPAGVNGQEARRIKNRERLVVTASRLFRLPHPTGVTGDDIVQAADLAEGAF